MATIYQFIAVVCLLTATIFAQNTDDEDDIDENCVDEKNGCFKKKEFLSFFSNMARNLPEHPDKVNVTYFLFNDKHKLDPIVQSYDSPVSLLKSSFNPKYPTVFVIHGWSTLFGADEWSGRLVHKMLNDDPQLNVFGVDWSGGAKNTNYFQSAFDGKMVGLIIANFIKKLMKEYNISPSSISIVGHSVGGQIPAFIGKEFTSPKIRHILSLDPAKPFWDTEKVDGRINPDAADVVEIVRTDSGFMGTSTCLGDVNIHPNGGRKQPGCKYIEQVREGTGYLKALMSGCDHVRATFLVLDNFAEPFCQPVAYACSSYKDFKNGKCTDCGVNNENCWLFGVQGKSALALTKPNKEPAHYYFDTAATDPYCLNHYAFGIFTDEFQEKTSGTLDVTINYLLHNVKPKNFQIKFSDSIGPSQVYWKVITTEHTGSIDLISSVSIKWDVSRMQNAIKNNGFTVKELHIRKLQLKLMSLWDPEMRTQFTVDLCSEDSLLDPVNVALDINKVHTFTPCFDI